MNDDKRDLQSARSAYNARKTESSIIAWVCSSEWTEVDRSEYGEYDPDGPRGTVYRSGEYTSDLYLCNAYQGDILIGEIP